jgi:hypothetical protein
LAPRLGGDQVGLDDRPLVGEPGLRQSQLLAAHRVDLLGDLGLAGEQVQLQVRVGQQCEQLALLDHGAVLDQHLLDPPALDRVEEDRDQGRHPRPQRHEVVEPSLADGRDCQPLGGDALAVRGRGEIIEGKDRDQQQRGADRDLGPLRKAAFGDLAVHGAAARRTRAVVRLHPDHAHLRPLASS